MAEKILQSRSAFPELSLNRYNGLTITVRDNVTMVSFAAQDGQSEQVKFFIQSMYGFQLPRDPVRVDGADMSFLWFGPDRWMAVADRDGVRDLKKDLTRHLHGLAAVVDYSDGRAVVCISGERAREVLTKGVPLDLHPRMFKTNDVAITHASRIGVLLWQVDDAPTYDIAVPRSYAHSFCEWLLEAAEEFREE